MRERSNALTSLREEFITSHIVNLSKLEGKNMRLFLKDGW